MKEGTVVNYWIAIVRLSAVKMETRAKRVEWEHGRSRSVNSETRQSRWQVVDGT